MSKLIKLILIPLLVTIIGGGAIYVIQRVIEDQTKPVLLVSSDGGSLVLTNNTDQVLSVRVAYREVQGGNSTFCYPNPTAADGGTDPQVWPGDTQTFAPKHCNSTASNGYAVWAWNAQGDQVFHTEG